MEEARVRQARGSDLNSVERLLADAGLPAAGVADHLHRFLVAEEEGHLIGCAGLELYGTHALLRSVAVIPGYRNRGLARTLVAQALDEAAQLGVREVFLFTETAPEYFRRFGFTAVAREDVAEPVRASREFGACGSSAQAMRLVLQRPMNVGAR